MGKLRTLDIVLPGGQLVYYAGQVIQGTVNVVLDDSMKMRGIRLQINGLARVHWSERIVERHGTNTKGHVATKYFKAHEGYFNHVIDLYGKGHGQGGDNSILTAGSYSYPFQFKLPTNLPSSFEGVIGYVRYTMTAVIDKPWKFDHTTKAPFTVLSILDLNLEPNASMNLQGQNQKTLCCLCCKSGPISAVFKVDRTGYVPGESIRLQAEITNMSNRTMNGSSVDLKMVTVFRATRRTRTAWRQVAVVRKGAIPPGGSEIWNGEPLVLPPLPPSGLIHCRIIDIKYVLQLHVDPSGASIDLDIPLGILIGTIPLRSTMQNYQPIMPAGPSMPTPDMQSAPDYSGASTLPVSPELPADIPPPSYSDCIFGKTNIKGEDDNEYTRGNMNFAPRYTYYDWGNTPTGGAQAEMK